MLSEFFKKKGIIRLNKMKIFLPPFSPLWGKIIQKPSGYCFVMAEQVVCVTCLIYCCCCLRSFSEAVNCLQMVQIEKVEQLRWEILNLYSRVWQCELEYIVQLFLMMPDSLTLWLGNIWLKIVFKKFLKLGNIRMLLRVIIKEVKKKKSTMYIILVFAVSIFFQE